MKRLLTCLLLSALASCGGASGTVEGAADEARSLAFESHEGFKILVEHVIEPGSDSSSVPVKLQEAHCYRLIGVRASTSSENVELGIKHPEEMIERGTDLFDLTPEDADRSTLAVLGMCVWPAFAGELTAFHNLSETGGFLLVVEAKAEKLSWRTGEDVKLYLAGTGAIDLEQVQKEEAETKLTAILTEDRESLPAHLSGKHPFFNDMISTRGPSWSHTFTINPDLCYHIFVASLNCNVSYTLKNAETGKPIHDDGVPDSILRTGWSQDVCPSKKHFEKDATLAVGLEMAGSSEFDKCWLGAAVFSYSVGTKQKNKIKKTTKKARNKAAKLLKTCKSPHKSCKKACKKKDDVELCKKGCASDFESCTSDIVFEGQISS
ncbi:MAG: hypothetical protein JRG91_03090 [Deltaproteobacteria bacterium]|nr:hypothetical protein [Deltaproteobacteria bacterium]